MPRESRLLMTGEAFGDLARRLAATARRPAADVAAALATPRAGRVVSLADAPAAPALASDAVVTPNSPHPYRLTQWNECGDGWTAVNDRLELDIHGETSMTHLDTTAHFASDLQAHQSDAVDPLVELASAGLICRGILIDVPGVLGASTAGQVITLADVHEVLRRTGLEPRPGDALHINLGRTQRARSDVPLGTVPTAGLSIECADWVAALAPSVVVTDEGLDPFPSEVAGLPVPWHVLMLTVLGVPLVDRAMLAPLSGACAEVARWEFLSVIAPLPIPGASGSPVNPVAVL
jgi:kynurenine formamidase